jgi:hypothetical protein
MIRLIIVLGVIIAILFIMKSRKSNIRNISQNTYKIIIISIMIIGLLFLIATSGRYLLPQLLQLIKIGLPFLTKFIGI